MPTQPLGEWEVLKDENDIPIDSLVTAVHANLIPIITSPTVRPKAKVLYWHGRYITNYEDGGKIVSCLYDPVTKEIKQYTVPIWPNISAPYDPSKIFCSAHLTLADGKLLTSGGERNIPPALSRGIKYSFIFDSHQITLTGGYPWRNTNTGIMQVPTLMDRGRWYPQLTKLHDGKVVAMSGYKYEDQAVELRTEIFDASNEIWTLFDVSAELAVPLYNGAHLIPFGDWKGQIFYDLVSFGTNLYPNPWTQAHRFKPDILNPEWHPVGTILPLIDKLRYRGNSVVFPFRSTDTRIIVLNIGGGQPVLQNTAEIIILGESSNPNWIPIENLSFNRHDAPSALFLAEGTLMVIGGGHDMETVLTPEYLDYSDPDPSNWKWYNLPDMEVPRKYHSVALLIPDGSVWVAGSRIYDDPQRWEFENDMERRIEIYKPGYFFDGIRPIITKAPININYGIENHFTLLVSLDDDPNVIIDSIVLINLPSVTHCFDCSQRYIILDFVKNDDGEYEVTPPLDSYIAQPGYYMLFVIKDKSQSNSGLTRLPSEALIVKMEL